MKHKRMLAALLCTILFIVPLAGCNEEPVQVSTVHGGNMGTSSAQTTLTDPSSEADASPAESPSDASSASTVTATPPQPREYDSLGPALKNISDTGVLNAAIGGNKPPNIFQHVDDSGNMSTEGFEVALMKGLAEELSVVLGKEITLNLVQMDGVTSILASLQAGKSHVGVSLSPTEERKKTFDFSNAYYKSLQTIAYLKEYEGEDRWKLENGLEGVTVASQLGSSNSQNLAEQYPKCTIVDLNSNADGLMAVLTKKCDALLVNEPVGILYCHANPELMLDLNLAFKSDPAKDPGACIAFQYDNGDFKEVINNFLLRIKEDGTFDNDYFGNAIEKLDSPLLFDQYKLLNLVETKQ